MEQFTLKNLTLIQAEQMVMKDPASDLQKLTLTGGDDPAFPNMYLFFVNKSLIKYVGLVGKKFDVVFGIKYTEDAKISSSGRAYPTKSMKIKFISATQVA